MTPTRKIKEAYLPNVENGPTRLYRLKHTNGQYIMESYNVTLRKETGYTMVTVEPYDCARKAFVLKEGRWSQKEADSLLAEWEELVDIVTPRVRAV